MHILENIRGMLREVEDCFVSNKHNMKGHFFRCVEMRCLKTRVFRKMEIYKFVEIT